MRKWIVLSLCIFIGIGFAFDDARPAMLKNEAFELAITPKTYEPLIKEVLEEMDTVEPYYSRFLGSEPIQLGTTFYDMQHNSTLGRNIAVDDEGGIHVTWMKSSTALLSSRQIYYSYIDPSGEVLPMAGTSGIRCDFALYKSGYTTIDTYGCSPFIAYHEANSSTADYHCQVSCDVVAIESGCIRHGGFGDCDPFPPLAYFPEYPSEPIANVWPVIAVSQYDSDVHIISTSSSTDTTFPNYCVYYHGTLDGSEVNFEEDGIALYEVYGVTPSIAAANDRDEIAVAFVHYMEDYTCTWVDGINVFLMTSSDDGESWDTTNITGNTGDFRDMPFDTVYYDVNWIEIDSVTGDTTYTPGIDTSVFYTRPSGGLSIFYDDEDYIHITWTEAAYPNVDSCTGTTVTAQARSTIKHWSNRSYRISNALNKILRSAPWPGGDASNPRYFCSSYNPNGTSIDSMVYVIWQQNYGELYWMDYLDPDVLAASDIYYDRSAAGNANQEIFLSYSTDYGESWSIPIDVSNTYTPGCEPGECHSELDPTIARKVDDYIHIAWIDDNDGGIGIHDLGSIVECPVKCTKILLDTVYAAAVDEEVIIGKPDDFTLSSNFPNPFNMATQISYTIAEPGAYCVEVFDLEGKLVNVLANNHMAKGEHITLWNGTDMSGLSVSSGTYLYRIRDNKGNAIFKKMTLIK